jgi:hypothetical protein
MAPHEWAGTVRTLLYPVIFKPDPVAEVERVMVLLQEDPVFDPGQDAKALRAGLASDEPLRDLVNAVATEQACREYLRLLLDRLTAAARTHVARSIEEQARPIVDKLTQELVRVVPQTWSGARLRYRETTSEGAAPQRDYAVMSLGPPARVAAVSAGLQHAVSELVRVYRVRGRPVTALEMVVRKGSGGATWEHSIDVTYASPVPEGSQGTR